MNAPPLAGQERPRLVLVDDEPETVNLIRMFLELFDFDVATALTGEGGLEAIARHKPQAVILDLMLPDMDGLEVCRKIRATPGTTRLPVIMLTARAGKEEVLQGYEAGATLYLKKPVDLDRLVKSIRQVLATGRHVTRPLDQRILDAEERASDKL